jgi:formylglycine-generating enzyme required for sulfatase activity
MARVALVAAGLLAATLGPRAGEQRVDQGSATVERPAPFEQPIAGTALSLRMVGVPAGAVRVEREGELVEPIEIGPFWMSATEIPWELYDVLVFALDRPEESRGEDAVTRPTQPYVATDRGFGHAGWPAISISAQGAEAFCAWLAEKTGRRWRLPTEAEWVWAATAGAQTRWPFGDDPEALVEHAWFRANAERKTHRVGTKPANAWGLHDMFGNAAEWCTTAEGGHALRGGSYQDRADDADRFARKLPSPLWNRSDPQLPKSPWWLADAPFAGFRVVCELEADGKDDDEARAADPSDRD